MASLSKPITVAGLKGKAASRGRMPTKRTINLAKFETKKTNWWLAIPGIIIILVLAFLFGKFAVADLLSELSYDEIAALLHMRPNTAAVMFHRAKEKIRKQLREEYGYEI